MSTWTMPTRPERSRPDPLMEAVDHGIRNLRSSIERAGAERGKSMTTVERVIPPRIELGHSFISTMAHCMGQRKAFIRDGCPNPFGYRVVMGFYLPPWQRGLVWTEAQNIAFIESAWLGIPIGTYTYNQADIGSPLDNLLIDGQQRMNAIERYLDGKFKVFGYFFDDLPVADQRRWGMATIFSSYVSGSDDEDYLRGYYNLMNFGGVAHKAEERA